MVEPAPLAADEALKLLKDGNARFAAGKPARAGWGAAARAAAAKGPEHPFAVILGCSDSRVPPEIVFDQGPGGLYVVRVAGNVAGPDEIASVEYAVAHLGALVVLVLGHTSCDAVGTALWNPHLGGGAETILDKIRPAAERAKTLNPAAKGEDLLKLAVAADVRLSMETLLRKSPVVRDAVRGGRILLEGGVYGLVSGRVVWLGRHPEQGRLLAEPTRPAPARKRVGPRRKAAHKAKRKAKSGVAKAEKSESAGSDRKAASPARAKAKAASRSPAESKAARASGGDSGGVLPPPE